MLEIILKAQANLKDLQYVSTFENYFVYEYSDPIGNKTIVKIKEVTGYEYEVIISVLDIATEDQNIVDLQTFTSISAKDQVGAIKEALSRLAVILNSQSSNQPEVTMQQEEMMQMSDEESITRTIARLRWTKKRSPSLICKELNITNQQFTDIIETPDYRVIAEEVILSGIESDTTQQQQLKEMCWRARTNAKKSDNSVDQIFTSMFGQRMLLNETDAELVANIVLMQKSSSGKLYNSYLR